MQMYGIRENNTSAAKTKLMCCKSNFIFYANMGTTFIGQTNVLFLQWRWRHEITVNSMRTVSELFITEASQPGDTMNGRQGFTTLLFFLFALPIREGFWGKRISCTNPDLFPDYQMRIRFILWKLKTLSSQSTKINPEMSKKLVRNL